VCFVQTSIFTRQSCCSQSHPTKVIVVMHNEALGVPTCLLHHEKLQHAPFIYFILDVYMSHLNTQNWINKMLQEPLNLLHIYFISREMCRRLQLCKFTLWKTVSVQFLKNDKLIWSAVCTILVQAMKTNSREVINWMQRDFHLWATYKTSLVNSTFYTAQSMTASAAAKQLMTSPIML